MPRALLWLLAPILAACDAAPDESPARLPEDGERARPEALAPDQARAPRLRVTPVAVATAEDGTGARVAARAPLALDVLDARQAGALDPVLELGALEFRDSTYPAPGVLRFVVADGRRLPADVDAVLRYGHRREVVRPIEEVVR